MLYRHLTERERYVISHLHGSGYSDREIGRRLQRSHTTISREVARNKGPYARYWYTYTHDKAIARRHQPRHKRCQDNIQLMNYIKRQLEQKWSPEQIANRLIIDYPQDCSMRMSPEAIYRWLYKQAAQGDRQYIHLRRGRKKRRKQSGYATDRGLIRDRVSISERPPCVDKRSRFGDWEGDTVIGKQGTGAIVTHVERKSRYLIAAKLESKQAYNLTQKSIKLYRKIKRSLRITLTLDNGKEFSEFKTLEKQTGLNVYFADPYSSWQRGCNENTNGLLRQFFPKGYDFRNVTDKEVAKAVRNLNNRPRKILNYQTPSEVFTSAQSGALAC